MKTDDMLRTTIQDYLCDICDLQEDNSEELADGLLSYLAERGYVIVDYAGRG